MIRFSATGDWKKTTSYLKKLSERQFLNNLEKYGQQGVNALAAATPRETGETASSWYYKIHKDSDSYSILWMNDNIVGDKPLAIMLQYGYGTRNGGYVQGKDYINPAMRPVFDRIARQFDADIQRL